jgi:hypothetical protein
MYENRLGVGSFPIASGLRLPERLISQESLRNNLPQAVDTHSHTSGGKGPEILKKS